MMSDEKTIFETQVVKYEDLYPDFLRAAEEFAIHEIPRYARAIWLFTFSDLKTIVLPSTTCGTVVALGASHLSLPQHDVGHIALRLPLVLLWCWLNLLPFDIDNQRQPDAIKEDALNKSWRPLPSYALTPQQAKTLMFGFYPLAICVSFFIGGLRPAVALVGFGYIYNDLGGAERGIVVRNLINAAGYSSFNFGAAEVALGPGTVQVSLPLAAWLAVIATVVVTTVHSQDMGDQAGDRARGRMTVPLAFGDKLSRWSIATLVLFWSCACPLFWAAGILGYAVPLMLGAVIAQRTLSYRTVAADKKTFRVWNAWMVTLYLLPLLTSL